VAGGVYALNVRHPSVSSVVVLLLLYWVCVIGVHAVAVPVVVVRHPSEVDGKGA